MLYIVMEYIDGADLQQMMRTGGLTVDHLFDWISQVCEALQYAHSQGIVHRDIKPGNIMISREGIVKVADFGLAKLTGGDGQNTRLTMTNMTMGTPDYVAPEALEEGIEVDHRADIYAVGVMLYEMLTGKVPRGSWRPPSMVNSHIDSRFDALVTRAMEADRDCRFQNISEISSELTSIWTTTDDSVPLIADKIAGGRTTSRGSSLASGAGVTGGQAPGSSPKKAGRSKSGLWIGITVAITVLLVAAGWFLMRPPSDTAETAGMAVTEKETVLEPSSSPSREETPEAAGIQDNQPQENSLLAAAPTTKPAAEKPVPEETVGSTAIASAKMEEQAAGDPPKPGVEEGSTPKPGDSTAGQDNMDKPKVAKSSVPEKGTMGAAPASAPLTEAGRRVAELLGRYDSGYRRTMLAPHEKALEELKSQYVRALGRRRDAIAASGNLDHVIAFRDEIERVESGGELPSPDESGLEELSRLRGTYLEQVGRLEDEHRNRIATLINPLDAAFLSLEEEFTKAGKVEEALEIRQERLRIREEGMPFAEIETATLFSGLAENQSTEEEKESTNQPPIGINEKEFSSAEAAAADRKAAEWALTKGGRIELDIDGSSIELRGPESVTTTDVAALLPEKAFQLVTVDFNGNRNFSNEEFARFPASPGLRNLNLGQTLFSDRASARVLRRFPSLEELQIPFAGADEWAGALEDVPTLRRVSFYRTQLTDDGARELVKAPWLVHLQVSESDITPRSLDSIGKLTNLEELLISDPHHEFDDDDLEKLYALTNLKSLTLHKWKVTMEGVRELKKKLPGCRILYRDADGKEVVEE